MSDSMQTLEQHTKSDYKFGFSNDIESDKIPKGLNEDTIRLISAKKNEPDWMLEWRLEAYRIFMKMTEPNWVNVTYPPVDLQNMVYYAAPKKKPQYESLDEVDPELLETFDKLGIPLEEQKMLAGSCRGRGF